MNLEPSSTVPAPRPALSSRAASHALTVVKLGGSLLEDRQARETAIEAIASLWTAGGRVVVVHGGGKQIDRNLAAFGIPKRVEGGLRVTDAATLDVVVSVLAGSVNKALVGQLRSRGVLAAGLSGADGETLWAEYHEPVGGVELGFVGEVVKAKPALLSAVLDAGLLPVVASLAMGRDGVLLNVNADAAASALAAAFRADRLVFFTDVEGVRSSEGSVVVELTADEAKELLASPAISGGMRPKLQACLAATAAGVPEVVIAGPSRHATVLADGRGGTRLVH